jgi:hypothetical protein
MLSPPAIHVGDLDIIKEKTMASIPPWLQTLCLSLMANNWLEWSCELLNGLKMAQLHIYPLGILSCPNQHTDCISHCNWRGNDQMVLGYINSHIFASVSSSHVRTQDALYRDYHGLAKPIRVTGLGWNLATCGKPYPWHGWHGFRLQSSTSESALSL